MCDSPVRGESQRFISGHGYQRLAENYAESILAHPYNQKSRSNRQNRYAEPHWKVNHFSRLEQNFHRIHLQGMLFDAITELRMYQRRNADQDQRDASHNRYPVSHRFLCCLLDPHPRRSFSFPRKGRARAAIPNGPQLLAAGPSKRMSEARCPLLF